MIPSRRQPSDPFTDAEWKLIARLASRTPTATAENAVASLRELIRTAHIERLIARRGEGTTLTLRTLSRMRRDA